MISADPAVCLFADQIHLVGAAVQLCHHRDRFHRTARRAHRPSIVATHGGRQASSSWPGDQPGPAGVLLLGRIAAWFVQPWFFIAATALVTMMLSHGFHSPDAGSAGWRRAVACLKFPPALG